ncbi:MAG: hypothetical protein JKY95_01275 [Planctomycetaceae bacterium]|nr:hypothetical protein [Planctomycetaceae bacterium]
MSRCRIPVNHALCVMLLSCAAFIASSASLQAQAQPQPQQAPAQAGNAGRLPRPAPRAMPAAIDSELKHILQTWEAAGKVTKKMEGRHSRLIYDDVFAVKKVSEGQFFYEAPDKGRIDLGAPKGFKPGETVLRNGKKYSIEKDNQERWICDGTQIFAIDEERKEFQRIIIPERNRGQNIVDGPLPFLFGISMEKVLARYDVVLYKKEDGGQHNYQGGIIHLKVKPKKQQDAANWHEAEVMLNSRDYLPIAIRLKHPGGNSETVYVFSDVKRIEKKNALINVLWGKKPFSPSLRGYKELVGIAGKPSSSNQPQKK